MTRRLVIGLADSSKAESVRSALRELGMTTVEGPRPELPDVLVATPPSDDASEQLAADVAQLDGVSYAEPESLYEGFTE